MKFNKELLLYIMLVLFFLMAIMMYLGIKDANQCLGNPFKYGVAELENKDTGGLHCTCYFENINYAPFYFNKKEIGVLSDLDLDINFEEKAS